MFGVPSGSVLGLFYSFFKVNERDVTSYGNVNTSFFVDTNIHDVIRGLKIAWESLFQWLNQNLKNADSGKYHFTCSSNVNIMRKNKKLKVLEKSFYVCFLKTGIPINNIQYLQHTQALKLKSIFRIKPCMDFNKKALPVTAVITAN